MKRTVCTTIMATVLAAAATVCYGEGWCASNAECTGDYYCYKLAGNCDGKGICTFRPAVCPQIVSPVCGCNNQTYMNACKAAEAGVNIKHVGACEPNGCFNNGNCPPGYYCSKTAGQCSGGGACSPRPDACIALWKPVCGCDGQTYSNDCTAAAAGVNVRHTGACEPNGCFDNSDCPAGYYCSKTAGECSGKGACSPRPDACVALWNPVCGCDGQTYSNDCAAAAAGVSIKHIGECMPPGPVVVMMEPKTTPDGVHTGQSGLTYLRILWSEPIVFDSDDITITDESGAAVGYAASTDNSAVMTIRFAKELVHGAYTITVSDSAYGFVSSFPIDGDDNGVTGGDAVIVMEHRMRGDLDNNNKVNLTDLAIFAESWLTTVE